MFDSRKINGYLSAMAEIGFSANQVLRNSWIKEPDLANPEFVIDIAQAQVIIRNMVELTGNNALGLELGRRITIGDMGVVGYGMLTSATIRDAVNLWIDFASSLYGTMVQLQVQEGKSTWHLILNENLPMGICYQFCMEEYLVLSQYLGECLTGMPTHLTSVQVVYPDPGHSNKYRKLLRCPVKFSADINRISIRKPALDEPLQRQDEYLHRIYRQYCERNATRTWMGGALSSRVRNHLLKNLGQVPNLDKIAAELGCSGSTLRRRLCEEGVSFRQILREFRCDMAEQYLSTTHISVRDISYLLGYKDPKPFLRAFKEWTGMTTGGYKKQGKMG